MAITAKLSADKKKLVIEADLMPPTPSKKGKNLIVATSHGNAPTAVQINNAPVVIGFNAYIRNPDYVPTEAA